MSEIYGSPFVVAVSAEVPSDRSAAAHIIGFRCSNRGKPGAATTATDDKKYMCHWRGAMPGMKLGAGWGLRVVCGGCGWRGRCMLVVACRPSSPVRFGPFEAADKY